MKQGWSIFLGDLGNVPVIEPAEVCSRWASAPAKPCVITSSLPCSQSRWRVSHSTYNLQGLNLKPVGNTNSRKGIVQTQPGFLWDGPYLSLCSFCLSLALFLKCPCQTEMQKIWKFWAELFSMTSTNYWSERKMSWDDTEHWAGEKGGGIDAFLGRKFFLWVSPADFMFCNFRSVTFTLGQGKHMVSTPELHREKLHGSCWVINSVFRPLFLQILEVLSESFLAFFNVFFSLSTAGVQL